MIDFHDEKHAICAYADKHNNGMTLPFLLNPITGYEQRRQFND